ncbi:MAG TPA: cold shock domain-containing protein, partial [Cyclobacteriaceae bacterium]|nr:cold shock domain-containing protein [Cyclobacteriaceae bacterium]
MAKPETFNKKELEKRKAQKKKEKEERKEKRKEESKGGKSLDDMLAYVDEWGNITSTPPDASRKKDTIAAADIVIGSRNIGKQAGPSARTGRVTFFNTSKGFGFIRDDESGESVFMHTKSLSEPVTENDRVSFTTEHGPKG